MKTGMYALLEVYEELREESRFKALTSNREKDWYAFLYYCDKCKEVVQQIEDEKREDS